MAITHTTNHVALGLARLVEQYRGTNVVNLLTAFLNQKQRTEDGFYTLLGITIDGSEGAQLDMLGRIVGEPRKSRDDDTYRLWIRARIRANRSSGTVEDLIQTLVVVLEGCTPRVQSFQPATVIVSAEGAALPTVDVPEISALLRVAAAAGVRALLAWSVLPASETFSLAGGDGAGLGDVSDPTAGGGLAGITETV